MEFLVGLKDATIAFIQANHQWAAPIAFLVSFTESLAFLSLVFPGTAILVAASFLVGASNISFAPVYLAAALGGVLGYSISYGIGAYFKKDIAQVWPFTRHPELLPRGHEFFEKWGGLSVFFGHFFGPVRAVIPVVAGIVQMPQLTFQIANISSAFLWAFGVMAPGAFGLQWVPKWLVG